MGGRVRGDQLRYVEDFGLLFEQFGKPRMVGRVLGVLLVSGWEEHSAEELADILRASRGSISSATRTLVQSGLVQRVSRPGERRDYFRVRPGAWNELMRERMVQVYALREMAERGLSVLDAVDPYEPEARRGLEEMRDFYAYWERELPAVLERWEQQNTTIKGQGI
jgi:DNA-binding transcriptional regulator GbsR (MarR family)